MGKGKFKGNPTGHRHFSTVEEIRWHLCTECEKPIKFLCYTCTHLACEVCVKGVEFLHDRKNRGFSESCMQLVLMIEENKEVNSDGKSDLVEQNDITRIKSSVEHEEEMIANMPKFKARPLNKKILEAPTLAALPRRMPQLHEFQVSTKFYSDDWPTLASKLAFEKSVFTKTQKTNAFAEGNNEFMPYLAIMLNSNELNDLES